jgi:hypothetical protein
MARIAKIVVVGIAAAVAFPAAAIAQSANVVGPYDGEIPFNCELQNVGTGTDFPEPHADPFCVEFDKTNQNLTDFGLADFTAQEPARVAAAGDKCFYFQRDHWTGSIVQGQSPEVWHWDGNYFYDRARGVGGVSVRDFRLGGAPQSASPYAPPAYQPYFDENGGGGVEVLLESDPDPTCAVKVDTPEERDQVYGDRAAELQCIEPGGGIRGAKVGKVKLGSKRSAVRAKLGPPTYSKSVFDAWCLVGKGELRVAYGKGRAGMIVTSGSGQSYHGVSRGDRESRAFKRLDLSQHGRIGQVRLFGTLLGNQRLLFVGIAHGRVRWILLTPEHSDVPGWEARNFTRRMP